MPPTFVFEARQTPFEAQPPGLESRGGERASKAHPAQLGEGFAHERQSAMRLRQAMFVVNGKLLVRFQAFSRTIEQLLPQLASQRVVAIAFG